MKAIILILSLISFTVFANDEIPYEQMQQQMAPPPLPVQKQLEFNLTLECREKLEYYKQKIDDHKIDAYYKFMYRVWERRCLDKK